MIKRRKLDSSPEVLKSDEVLKQKPKFGKNNIPKKPVVEETQPIIEPQIEETQPEQTSSSNNTPFVDVILENEVLRHLIYDDSQEQQSKSESDEVVRNIGYITNVGISEEYFNAEFKQSLFKLILRHYIDYSECCGKSTIIEWIKSRYYDNVSIKIDVIDKILSKKFRLNALKPLIERLQNKYFYRKIFSSTDRTSEELKQAFEKDDNNAIALARHIDEAISPILLSSDKHRIIEEDVFQNIEKDIAELKDHKLHPEKHRGIPSGFRSIDDITGGFKPGELIVVQGRPGTGKSVLLMNFGFYAYYFARKNVAYVTVEMPIEQQKKRFFSKLLKENYGKFRNPDRFSDQELEYVEKKLLEEKAGAFSNKFWIIDAPENSSAAFIESRIVSFENMFGKKIHELIIDPLYLLKPSNPKSDDPVGTVSWDLKLLARKLNIPVITASQVNREGGKRQMRSVAASTMDAAFSDKVSNNSDTMMNILADTGKTDSATIQFPKTRDSEKPTNLSFKTNFAHMSFEEETDAPEREGGYNTEPQPEAPPAETTTPVVSELPKDFPKDMNFDDDNNIDENDQSENNIELDVEIPTENKRKFFGKSKNNEPPIPF